MANISKLIQCLSLMLLVSVISGSQATMDPHPPFVEEPNLWDIDPKVPIEHQVVQLTGAMYD